METKRKYAVLLCAEDSEYVKNEYGGYLKVFMGLLEEEGEEWEAYRVARGEFPADGDVESYDGFVISGSCSDAHGDEDWIKKLIEFVRRLNARKKKLLGVCFGHQIIGRALGGNTGRAFKGWDIGVTPLHLSSSLNKFFSPLDVPPQLSVIECHRDEVLELPPFVEVLARSEKTGIEMFKCDDHIMGIQGHPEYTKGILLHLVDRLLDSNLIEKSHAENVKKELNEREPDREAWERLCRVFLKGKLSQ
ncbi:gamma-glutamyl peptidase 3-like [Dendrobium catenatum]|uniref:GMP synthase (Glutamine-hydrolysing) n=1 Tax=Dendrobium catenatum TaxID=906689 RepID=A0A2I0VY64_9ASPA|nr:gamma-glutamyl peptidase 3-like [Dendrobium catenatum]PKU68343.1 GMP synthase (glutamine-hydrolysing) [Dendrobium catenatum]